MTQIYCRQLVVFILLCGFPWQAATQSNTFQKTYGGPESDFGSDVLVLDDGYVVVGEIAQTPTNSDAIIIRTDLEGNVLWQKAFTSAQYDYFRSIIKADNDNFIVWGTIGNEGTQHAEGLLLKMNTNGDIQWKRTMGDPDKDVHASGDIIPFGSRYMVSSRYSRFDPPSGGSVFTVLNNAGDLTNNKGYNHDYTDIATNFPVQIASATAVYACGNSSYPTAIMRLDVFNGNPIYVRQIDSIYHTQLTSLKTMSDGNLLACGSIAPTGNESVTKVLLAKIDLSNFEIYWSKILTVANWEHHHPELQVWPDGNFLMTIDDNAGHSVLAKIDQNGNPLWCKDFGGLNYHQFYRPKPTPDGGIVFAGNTMSGGQGKSDIYLVKTDADGNIPSCASVNLSIAVEGYDLQPLKYGSLNAFPSLFTNQPNIEQGPAAAIGSDFCESPLFLWFLDADNDGFGTADSSLYAAIQPSGFVSPAGDCNDNNPAIYPGATEILNGIDDNCNGMIDEGFVATGEAVKIQPVIYPNPVTDVLHIVCPDQPEWQQASFTLVDATGRQLRNGVFSGNAQLSIGAFPAGMYCVTVTGKNGRKSVLVRRIGVPL